MIFIGVGLNVAAEAGVDRGYQLITTFGPNDLAEGRSENVMNVARMLAGRIVGMAADATNERQNDPRLFGQELNGQSVALKTASDFSLSAGRSGSGGGGVKDFHRRVWR